MKQKYLEAGQIVNTHGIRGEIKIMPWCDGAEFLKQLNTFYLDGKAYAVENSRVQKQMLLCKLRGIDDVAVAQTLKNKILLFDRDDAPVSEDRVFIADLIGLTVWNGEKQIGTLKDVYTGPANDVYIVKGEGNREYMIPAVAEFLEEVNPEEGYIRVKLIPGMANDDESGNGHAN